jgi:DNA repair protein RecO (recombination protein O)
MDWREDGVLLAVRRHGETAAIIEVFTESHGRHAGVVRGGAGRRLGPVLQPGAQLDLAWHARLAEHLGSFTVEPLRSRAGTLMGDPLGLAGLASVCALLAHALPERAAYPALYRDSRTLLDLILATDAWPLAYLRWEIGLLATLGFALDLGRCAVTGVQGGLAYVSPRTGRAVSTDGARGYEDRLLPLPPCLLGVGDASNSEIAEALGVTGHFLKREIGPQRPGQPFPPARQRLLDRLARSAG